MKTLYKYRWQYGMISLGLICLLLFSYWPMTGLQIAFKNYRVARNTIWSAPWVGFKNFWFLSDPEFWRVCKNTVLMTSLKFLFSFPAPIILALLLNEVRNTSFKRVTQSITYIPHFISWAVIAYMLESLLSPYNGVINDLIAFFGGEKVFFMGRADCFLPMFIIVSVWKELGWGTIVYMAAITNIEQEMYEAAKLDGANRWQEVLYITLPSITPTISMLLILALPGLLSTGVDSVYPLQNAANLEVSTVLDTYILNNGLERGQYSFSTAVGMVSSVLSFILVISANALSNKLTGDGLF